MIGRLHHGTDPTLPGSTPPPPPGEPGCTCAAIPYRTESFWTKLAIVTGVKNPEHIYRDRNQKWKKSF